MLQVKLWQGSWLLPDVPIVDHLSPYVKTSYLDDFYEHEEAELNDESTHSPLPATTTTTTTLTTINDMKNDGEDREGQTFNDRVDDILENLPPIISKG